MRKNFCPFLLRVWVSENDHKQSGEFTDYQNIPSGALHVHTWLDCSLRELLDTIKQVHYNLRKNSNAEIEFAMIYPGKEGDFKLKKFETLHCTERREVDKKTLADCKLEIGDFLSLRVVSSSRSPKMEY